MTAKLDQLVCLLAAVAFTSGEPGACYKGQSAGYANSASASNLQAKRLAKGEPQKNFSLTKNKTICFLSFTGPKCVHQEDRWSKNLVHMRRRGETLGLMCDIEIKRPLDTHSVKNVSAEYSGKYWRF